MRFFMLLLPVLAACQIGLSAAATLPPGPGDGAYCEPINEGLQICRTDGDGSTPGKEWFCRAVGAYWECERTL